MADPTGFLKTPRELPARRPVDVRIRDWNEVYTDLDPAVLRDQAGRCMDCGIPFCHNGCPLGNLIPEWNDLAWRGDWREAIERLHATNNFPEFTGRICPAPCEAACVLGINADAVTIKQVEVEIVDRAFAEGWVTPVPPRAATGRTVGVVGSGPAGLAAAQQLTRAGHSVTVYERADRIGGLLRYGIPEFKLEKHVLERRLAQMESEGTVFVTGVDVGTGLATEELLARHDAVLLAGGSTLGRDLEVEGRHLRGIHLAMDYLPLANRVQEGDLDSSPLTAAGLDVVIIGGGDTGADCLGTAHRQGAASVTQLEILSEPPRERPPANPWPTWPVIYRTSSAHEEGGRRVFGVSTVRFVDDGSGQVGGLELVDVEMVEGRPVPVEGTGRVLPTQLVLLAMGFVGPQRVGLLEELGLQLDARGNVARDDAWATTVPGVFVAGDMGRGQSLVVWAIAEGRAAAAAVDRHLMGSTWLPEPVTPASR